MALLLDLATVAAVIAALAFLLPPRRTTCPAGEPRTGAQTIISLEQLRATARRAAGRKAGRPTAP